MKRIIVVLVSLVLMATMISVSIVAVADEGAYISVGDYNSDVIALHQKLAEFGYYYLRPESPWSTASENAVKILQENLDMPITGIVTDKEMYDEILGIESVIGKNFAVESYESWSDWFTPNYDAENQCFTLTQAILPTEKAVGDYYTCSVEIEFKDVTATEGHNLYLWSQGSVDGSWDDWNTGNIWNPSLISLKEVPQNGVYRYTATSKIIESKVDAVAFDLGLRCDYWHSGSFRVRNVKVEKGSKATGWKE